jgi:hypothetical protein
LGDEVEAVGTAAVGEFGRSLTGTRCW